MTDKRKFLCPDVLRLEFAGIFRGHYDMPKLEFESPPRILDCGANMGAFTVWAASRWTGATINAYEPHPNNVKCLRANTDGIPNLSIHEVALGDRQFDHDGQPSALLHQGRNAAVHSMYDSSNLDHDAKSIIVRTLSPRDLPPADILKIDTEGAEVKILSDYPFLPECKAVIVEWHRNQDKWTIGHLLSSLGFRCTYDVQMTKEIGEMKWLREGAPRAPYIEKPRAYLAMSELRNSLELA